MILYSIILFVLFVVVVSLDAYSTSKLMRYNHKLLHDRSYVRKVRKVLLEDETKAECSGFARYWMKKIGVDRALLYLTLLISFPMSLIIWYMLLVDVGYFGHVAFFGLLCFMIGVLYRQVLKAVHLNAKFGVKI